MHHDPEQVAVGQEKREFTCDTTLTHQATLLVLGRAGKKAEQTTELGAVAWIESMAEFRK